MGFLELIIVALALSMDAFAVTVANAIAYPDSPFKLRILMPISFGIFQGLMPVIGFLLANIFTDFIHSFAGIIAFLVLAIIGGKMIFEGIARQTARKEERETAEGKGFSLPREFSVGTILSQAVATSIDALVVGVGFVATDTNVALAAPIIAAFAFACCFAGLGIGKRFGLYFGEKAEIVGGAVLILLGVKALFF